MQACPAPPRKRRQSETTGLPALNRSKDLVLGATTERSANCFCFVVDNSYRHPSMSTYPRFAGASTAHRKTARHSPTPPRRARRIPSKGYDAQCHLPADFPLVEGENHCGCPQLTSVSGRPPQRRAARHASSLVALTRWCLARTTHPPHLPLTSESPRLTTCRRKRRFASTAR
jgi:hypothetical protein